MAKSNVYTRTGDDGTTSLVYGQRIRKDNIRLEAYGTIDELSSALGIIATAPDAPAGLRTQIIEIQNRLFDLGAYLATDAENNPSLPGITPRTIAGLEQEIDRMDAQIPPIRSFIIPGGSQLSAFAHLARTICRRAERAIVALSSETRILPIASEYVNRLSDYLFVAAKYINAKAGIPETLWTSAE